MKKIRQRIVSHEAVYNGHVLTYLEVLACGHTGQSRRTIAAIEQAIGEDRRRECYRCNRAQLDEKEPPKDTTPPRACAWCGRPCGPDDPLLCLACTLLSETDETDDSERWNYPEQHHDR